MVPFTCKNKNNKIVKQMSSRPWERRRLKTHSEWLHPNFAIYSQSKITNSLFQGAWNQPAFTTALKERVPTAPQATPPSCPMDLWPPGRQQALGRPTATCQWGPVQKPATGDSWGQGKDAGYLLSVWWHPKKPWKKLLEWETDWREGPATQASDSEKAVIVEPVVLICLA